jgi:hypothetical protein
MGRNMKVAILMIKKRAMEYSFGQTGESIKETGVMGSSMGRVH